MENTLAQSPAWIDQDENLKLNSDAAGVTSVENKAFKLNNEDKPKVNLILEKSEVIEPCESLEIPKQPAKNESPTLLGSAFKMMKTFFSPEKPKNKTSNSISQSSVWSSDHASNKPRQIILESEVQMSAVKSPFLEEHNLKDKEQSSTSMFVPVPFDGQSVGDDSFITSMSYDESFQSAVTHFDENSELNRNFLRVSDSALNSSQDLDLIDSCNSILENSECCLENTMLKNDSFSSKEISQNGFSMKNTNTERFNGVENCKGSDIELPIINGPNEAPDVGVHVPKANQNDSFIQISNDPSEMSDFNGGFPILNGVPNDSEVKLGESANGEKQIPSHQSTDTGFQQVEILPQNLSVSSECLNTVQKNKIDPNDSDITFAGESPVSSSYSFSPLSKQDMNVVEEMLLALKKDSGSTASLNFLDGNDIIISDNGNVTVKNSDFIDTNDKPDETKSKNADILNESRTDNLHEKTFDKTIIREKTQLIESQTAENENKLNIEPNNSNTNQEKVDEELTFGNSSVTPSGESLTVLYTTDKLSQTLIPNALIPFDVTPSSPVCSEVIVTETESESSKLFLGDGNLRLSIKHSTPVPSLTNVSSVVTQSEAVNSLELTGERDENVNIEKRDSSSHLPVKATTGISDEDQSSVLSKNLNEKDALPCTVSTESSKWILPPKSSNEFSQTFSDKSAWNNLEVLPPSDGLNISKKTKPDSLDNNSPKLEQIFCNNSASSTSEQSSVSKTLEPQEPFKSNQYEVWTVTNTIYDKTPHSGDDQTLSLSFDKKTDSDISKFCTVANDSPFKESKQLRDDVNRILENGFSPGFMGDSKPSAYVKLPPVKERLEPANVTSPKNANNGDVDGIHFKDKNNISPSDISPIAETTGKPNEHSLSEVSSEDSAQLPDVRVLLPETEVLGVSSYETVTSTESDLSANIEPDVAELIEKQFTPTDIAKICDIANLQETFSSLNLQPKQDETESKEILSPKSFDFLSAIKGKPTGRDLSRESLYVKFDPLVQPPTANSLIDFTKEVEALAASESPQPDPNSSICEELLSITPEKKTDVIVPPLTPLSDRSKKDKAERQKELQNEIYFLKNLYSERERINKAKIEEYETRIAKLTGDKCVLEDKLNEYGEREKSLVKKVTAQTNDIEQLKVVMKEYIRVISMLTSELETLRRENAKQIETITGEKESYMNHLQNTEAAFSDVHTKYEKSKKTIESLKKNEVMYKSTISEHVQKMEEYKRKAKEAQEKALEEFHSIMLALSESKNSHSQEVSRLRAQLKKTELKLEAVQESLDQKVKENQQLTAICDELIEGKK